MDHGPERNEQQQMEMVLLNLFHIVTFIKEQCGNDTSFRVNQIVRNWSNFSYSKGGLKCGMCRDASEAVGYCRDCCLFIDKLCLDFHAKIKNFINHKVFDLRMNRKLLTLQDFEPVSYCGRHKRVELDLYCIDCKDLLCSKCFKQHDRKRHKVNFVKDLYQLFDELHKTKHLMVALITRFPKNRNNHGYTQVLSTTIKWIDELMNVQSEHADINEMQLPPFATEIFQRSMETEVKTTYIPCKSVLEKIQQVQRELRDIENKVGTNDQISADWTKSASNNYVFSCAKYSAVAETLYNKQDEDESDSSYSSSDSSGSLQPQITDTNLNDECGALTMEYCSCTTDDLFPSLGHPEAEAENGTKTTEQEIAVLHAALNMDSFRAVHQDAIP